MSFEVDTSIFLSLCKRTITPPRNHRRGVTILNLVFLCETMRNRVPKELDEGKY
jgi:hypothetical protein